jgi:predicted DNA-binding transcriptional regulator AlpA
MSETTLLLTMPQVLLRVPFSRVHLYRLIAAGEFPRQVQVGARRVAWLETEVREWLEQRIAARDAQASDRPPRNPNPPSDKPQFPTPAPDRAPRKSKGRASTPPK